MRIPYIEQRISCQHMAHSLSQTCAFSLQEAFKAPVNKAFTRIVNKAK
jgi:hypothetical protein